MRMVQDEQGDGWDVAVGRESWGTLVLLFARREGTEVRKTVLAAETALEAEQELDELTDAELRARLASSQPWE